MSLSPPTTPPPAELLSPEARDLLDRHAALLPLAAAGGPFGLQQTNRLADDVGRWVRKTMNTLSAALLHAALRTTLHDLDPVGPYTPPASSRRIWFAISGSVLLVYHTDDVIDYYRDRPWRHLPIHLRRLYFPCLSSAIVDFDVCAARLALADAL